MPEPERVPTGSGELQRTKPASPEPADMLDAASAVNGPTDVYSDGWNLTGPVPTSLLEPVAVEVARPVPRGPRCSNALGLPDYVLAGGNAVNFLHGASVGAFIFLVQAEILAALARLSGGDIEPGYHEMPDADRRLIASIWLAHFNAEGTHS